MLYFEHLGSISLPSDNPLIMDCIKSYNLQEVGSSSMLRLANRYQIIFPWYMARCTSGFSLSIIFSVAARLGSCEMTATCQMSNVYTTCSLERSGNDILAFKLPILVEETSHHVIKIYCQHHCLYTSVQHFVQRRYSAYSVQCHS